MQSSLKRPSSGALLVGTVLAVCASGYALAAPSRPPTHGAILDAALRTAKSFVEPYSRAGITIPVAEAYARLGFTEEARQAMDEAVAIAVNSATPGHLLLQAGEACIRVELYRTAWQIADKTQHLSHAVHLLCETARAQIKAGRQQDAVRSLHRARGKAAGMRRHEPAGTAWTSLAQVYALAAMTQEFDEALERATALADEVERESSRSMLLERVAEVYLEAGRLDRTVQTAETIATSTVKVPLMAAVAEAYAEAGRAERAAAVLAQAAREAAAIPEPYRRAAMFIRLGASHAGMGRPELAAEALRNAEKAVGRIKERLRAASARDKLAAGYMAVDDLDAAERVIRGTGDSMRRSEQMVRLALQHAARGRYDPALRAVEQVEPELLAYAGEVKLKGIAEAYYHTWGRDAVQKRIEELEPRDLRDAVLAYYAEAWGGEKGYARAIRLARAIEFEVTRDDALRAVARACLGAADSIEAAGPAFEVLEMVEGRL
ncbi:MAG: hypothetical protein KAX19_02140, partial [Candidatus Brocadiae bacterium]|nr:hypothetical protein [Candidatus Brocadiia bacterium]